LPAVIFSEIGAIFLETLLKGGVSQAVAPVAGILRKLWPGFLKCLSEFGGFRNECGTNFAAAKG
jgi:hypothetical protein